MPITAGNKQVSNKLIMPAINWKHFALSATAGFIITGFIVWLTYSTPRLLRIDKVEFVNLTDSFINLRIACTVDNANFFTISGKNVAVSFSESDKLLGDGKIDTFNFRRTSPSTLTGTLRINCRQILRSYDQIKADTVEPAITITGRFMPCFFISKVAFREKVPRREIFRILFNVFRNSDVTTRNKSNMPVSSSMMVTQ